MPDFLRERRVYRSDIVEVADFHCRPHDGACGDEEFNAVSSVAFVRSGAFCKHVGREDVLADANQVVFFNAHEPYRVSHPLAGGDDCTSFRFDGRILADAAAACDARVLDRPMRPFPVEYVLGSSRSAASVHNLRHGAAGAFDRLRLDEICLGLLTEAIAAAYAKIGRRPSAVRPATRGRHGRCVDQTRLYLAEHSCEPISLARIADAVACSPYHLVRIFRREVGIPVHRYVTRLRLRAALERIDSGCDDFTTLALDLGFASHSHFSDSFRGEFGVAPKWFRKLVSAAACRQLSKNLEARSFRAG